MPNIKGDMIDLEDKEESLYVVLGLEKGCDDKAIKKAYYKLALQLHPDKIPLDLEESEKERAKKKFQNIGFAYSVLSDPQKRDRYDKTGSYDDSSASCTTFEEWSNFFDAHFSGKVNADTIEKFKKEYQSSEEERVDVIEAYKKTKGDMNKIFEHVILSSAIDKTRFVDYIEKAIDEGLIKRFTKFAETTSEKAHQKRIRREKREAKEFEASQLNEADPSGAHNGKNSDLGSLESLSQLIKANQNRREENSDAFFERLASRYSRTRDPASSTTNKRKKSTNKSKGEPELVESSDNNPRSKKRRAE